jgi:hypothetical protein
LSAKAKSNITAEYFTKLKAYYLLLSPSPKETSELKSTANEKANSNLAKTNFQ